MPVTPLSVFISYSRTDTDFVNRLDADLKTHGFRTWVDRGRLEGGDEWLDIIQQAIEDCNVLLVVLSPDAIQSRYVKIEYRHAEREGKVVIPLHYRHCAKVPMDLNGIQWVNFLESYDNALQRLLSALRHFKPSTDQIKTSPASHQEITDLVEEAKEPPLVVPRPALPLQSRPPVIIEGAGKTVASKHDLVDDEDDLGPPPTSHATPDNVSDPRQTVPALGADADSAGKALANNVIELPHLGKATLPLSPFQSGPAVVPPVRARSPELEATMKLPRPQRSSENMLVAAAVAGSATEPPKLEAKEPERWRGPGYKPPAGGITRYPWTPALVVILLATGVFALYANHVGPFALPKPTPAALSPSAKQTATVTAQKMATVLAKNVAAVTSAMPAAQKSLIAASPCLASSIISKVTNTAPAPTAAQFKSIKHTYSKAPAMSIDPKEVYCAGINTNRGLIVVELRPDWAPQTVNNFVFLAQNKFYDGIVFHRVNQTGLLKILQTGDPQGTGSGGPGYKFNDEPIKYEYNAGTVAMASGGPNTNGSQFFINLDNNTKNLQKSWNLFGLVVKGLDVALEIRGPGDDPNSKNIKPDVMNHVVVVPAS